MDVWAPFLARNTVRAVIVMVVATGL